MDERLEYYEREWKKAKDQLQECQEAQAKQARGLKAARDAEARAEALLKTFRKNIDDATSQIEAFNRDLEDAREAHAALDQDLENLRDQIRQPGFWAEQVEGALALDLEMYGALPELLPPDGSTDLADWTLRLVEQTEELAASFDESLAEEIRKRLIAHWVYVRWLELTALTDDT